MTQRRFAFSLQPTPCRKVDGTGSTRPLLTLWYSVGYLLDAHHVHHWARGGSTSLSNMVLLCSAHHRLLHDGVVDMKIGDSGEFTFYNRQGRELTPAGAPPAPESTLGSLRTVKEPITADCNVPLWDGWPIDYNAVIDQLHAM